jgi:hypothetical protein
MGRKPGAQKKSGIPGNERGKEPSKAYRQNLRQREDATYVNLGTV